MKVRATQLGFYEHIRRKAGVTFKLKDAKHFSPKWMVDASVPLASEDEDEEPAKKPGKRSNAVSASSNEVI